MENKERAALRKLITAHDLFNKHVDNGDGICKTCGKYLEYSRYSPADWNNMSGLPTDRSNEECLELLDYYMETKQTFYAMKMLASLKDPNLLLKYHTNLSYITANNINKKEVAWLSIVLKKISTSHNKEIVAIAKNNPVVAYKLAVEGKQASTFLPTNLFSELLSSLKKRYGKLYIKTTKTVPKELAEYCDGEIAHVIMNDNNFTDIPINIIENESNLTERFLKHGGKVTDNMLNYYVGKNTDTSYMIYNNIQYLDKKTINKFISEKKWYGLFYMQNKLNKEGKKVIELYEKYINKESQSLFITFFQNLNETFADEFKNKLIGILEKCTDREAIYQAIMWHSRDWVHMERVQKLINDTPKHAAEVARKANTIYPCTLKEILKDSEASFNHLINICDSRDAFSSKDWGKLYKIPKELKEIIVKNPKYAYKFGTRINRFDAKVYEALKYDYTRRKQYLEHIIENRRNK